MTERRNAEEIHWYDAYSKEVDAHGKTMLRLKVVEKELEDLKTRRGKGIEQRIEELEEKVKELFQRTRDTWKLRTIR